MKLVKEELKSGKTIYYLAIGLAELKLLRGIVVQAKEHMPAIFELMPTRRRLNNMSKVLAKAIKDLKYE